MDDTVKTNVIMNCDICDNDYPESTFISIGGVMWSGVKEMEMFICEECAQKVSEAYAKRKEASQ